jgi:hypothetical protein
MCRLPVTLGGGMKMTKGGLPLLGLATKGFSAHFFAHLGSTDLGS